MKELTEAEKHLELDPSNKAEFWVGYEEPRFPDVSDEAVELLAESLYVSNRLASPSDAFRQAESFHEYSRDRRFRKHREEWREAKLRDLAAAQAE